MVDGCRGPLRGHRSAADDLAGRRRQPDQRSPQSFLEDFKRARNNGFLARRPRAAPSTRRTARRAGQPAADGAPEFGAADRTRPSVTNIQQNEVAALADFYVTQRVAGALATFFPSNPGIYAARAIINRRVAGLPTRCSSSCGASTAAASSARSTTRSAKMTATASGGASQSRFEPYLDNARPGARTPGRSAVRHAPRHQRELHLRPALW